MLSAKCHAQTYAEVQSSIENLSWNWTVSKKINLNAFCSNATSWYIR